MNPPPQAHPGRGITGVGLEPPLPPPRADGQIEDRHATTRRLPWPLWAAVFLAPVLGWISALCLLAAAFLRALKQGPRQAVIHAMPRSGSERGLVAIALGWWLVLLAGDLLAAQPTPWWQDLRFLLVLWPAWILRSRGPLEGVTHEQIGRWATWSVWITAGVITLEYVMAVWWMSLVHHRPRALSGNALFVSVMLMPMMLWCWMAPPSSQGTPWMRPLATYLAGLICLASLLGARTATLIAILLLPLALWWHGRDRPWKQRVLPVLIGLGALGLVLIFSGPWMSSWYEQRWGAVVRVFAGTDPTALQDYGIATRAQHWPAAWRAFLERPWTGHGFLNEMAVLRQHLPAGAPVLPTAHQQFLSFLLWSGLPGLLSGVLFIGLPVIMVLIRRRGPTARYAAVSLAAPMLLNGVTDTVFDDLRIVSYHLMMVALLDSAVAREDPSRGSRPPLPQGAAT